ncbi:MAG: hypothetical protein OXL40_13205 [Bacteroidota bacterium]|nr:hypothetical protein [Bacteroidota bacterium]
MTIPSEHKQASATEADEQIEQNSAVYLEKKKEIENSYFGKIVLMHNGEIKGAYNDDEDAYLIGCDKYGLGNFSLHRVGQKPVELGFAGLNI